LIEISKREVIDIVANDERIIFVEKRPLLNSPNKYNVEYLCYDIMTQSKVDVTKEDYLEIKFGEYFDDISKSLINFVQCETTIFENGNVLVLYPNGMAGLYANGKCAWQGTIEYNSQPVTGLAIDSGYFWGLCLNESCAVRFSLDNLQFDLRIGGKDQNTFPNPTHITSDGEYAYICCDNRRIRRISFKDFTVDDVPKLVPNIKRFYNFGEQIVFCTSDGTYLA
jgi:hypothetical protein